MSDKTPIQWCDSTVNPTSGCDGCELAVAGHPQSATCYAKEVHENRLASSLPLLYDRSFHQVRLIPGRMAKAAAWPDLTGTDRPDKPWLNGLPRVIFIGDMGDTFSAAVSFTYLKSEVIDVVSGDKGRRHVWMWLTKQSKRAAEFSAWLAGEGIPWPPNLWPGVSITKQATMPRVGDLLRIGDSTTTRFVSAEPLLGPLDFSDYFEWGKAGPPWLCDCAETGADALVIVGGESGRRARFCDTRNIQSIINQCKASGARCFVKQIGSMPTTPDLTHWRCDYAMLPNSSGYVLMPRDSHGGNPLEWPAELRVRQFPGVTSVASAVVP